MDVAPTLLGVLGVSPPATVDGINLTPHLKNGTRPPERPIYSESLYLHLLLGWAELRSVRSGPLKLIDSPRPELYDLESDPEERADLIGERRKEWRALEKDLEMFRDNVETTVGSGNSETARRLESLGYVAGTTRRSGPARNPVDGMDVWREIEAGTTRAPRDPGRAREHFERALELDPENGLALKSLGDIALGEQNAEKALALYQASLRAGFVHPDLQLALGRAEFLAGQPEKALELFASMDQTEGVLIETARIELELGRAERARMLVSKVLATRPEDVEAIALLAQCQRASGLLEEAEKTLRRAIDLAPNEPGLHNELGAAFAQRGERTQAESSFREALRLDPEATEAQVNLAKLLEGAEAITLLREAIRLRPDFSVARVELAKRLAAVGSVTEAREQIEEALRHVPDEPEALFVAARIADLRGSGAEAAELYRRFLEVAPGDFAEPRRLAAERLEILSPR
jgi:tetratricopeptide (TPR) repeat protein